MRIGIVCIAAILVGLPLGAGYARTWTDLKGRQLDAEFVEVEGGLVRLKLTTGNKVEIKIETLSEADQEHIHGLVRQARSSELADPEKYISLSEGEHQLHIPRIDGKHMEFKSSKSSVMIRVLNDRRKNQIQQVSQAGSISFERIPDLTARIQQTVAPLTKRFSDFKGFYISEDRRALLFLETDESGRELHAREVYLWQRVGESWLTFRFREDLFKGEKKQAKAQELLRETLEGILLDGEKLEATKDVADILYLGESDEGISSDMLK